LLNTAKLKDDGTLEEIYSPSIYLDTNFLRHYYLAEGMEDFVDDDGNDVEPPWPAAQKNQTLAGACKGALRAAEGALGVERWAPILLTYFI
jgi:hypothetical protein